MHSSYRGKSKQATRPAVAQADESGLTYNERKALILGARFPSLGRADQRWLSVLLEKIFAHAANGKSYRRKWLADVMRCSEKTVQRAITNGVKLGVLRRRRHGKYGRGGRSHNEYEIDYEWLRTFTRPVERGQAVNQTGQADRETGQAGRGKGKQRGQVVPLPHNISARTQSLLFPLSDPLDESPSPSSSPAESPSQPAAIEQRHDQAGEWEAVVVELRTCGVIAADAAAAAARANGCTPAEVQAIIAHYDDHAGAWQPGALYRRVASARPGEDPADLWQLMDPRYVSRREQDERAAAAGEQARKMAAYLAHAAQLEPNYGAAVDALDPEQRRSWLPRQLHRAPEADQRAYLLHRLAADATREAPQ
jgi:hypothetical protein